VSNSLEFSIGRGHLFESDLDAIVRNSLQNLEALQSAKILIAGGSGFVGTWLAASLLRANENLNLELQLVVISRDRNRAIARLNPRDGDPFRVIESSLESLNVESEELQEGFTHVIHGGNSTSQIVGVAEADSYIEVAKRSMSNLLEVACATDRSPTFMHLSSGAVYGSDGRSRMAIGESVEVDESNLFSDPYSYTKWSNELMVTQAANEGKIRGTNPRLFAFAGPHIPLDQHFALGNFMKDALRGREIALLGNPSTRRSYLYPTDLVEWLLAVLNQPSLDTVHIGSEHAFEMHELVSIISKRFGDVPVSEGNPNIPLTHYVPETIHTRTTYGLTERVSLEEGIERWKNWLQTT
jgi:nucleoside-diphosphate-sugar epimerase